MPGHFLFGAFPDLSTFPVLPSACSRGLSPKKTHEITRLASFLHDLARRQILVEGKTAEDVVFVDVGSGLGYLGKSWLFADQSD